MNIKYVHMNQSGPIPGLVGWFNGGQTVAIDTDTMTVIEQAPLAQQAYDASPLIETPPLEEPAQEAGEPQEAPVQESTPPTEETTPVQEEAMPEVVAVPDLPEQINEGENN